MSARRVLGLGAGLLVLITARAHAQTGYRFQLQYLHSDSIVAGIPGSDVTVDLYAYDARGYGLNAFSLQIPFDASKLSVVAAQSLCPDSSAITLTPGAGVVTVSAPSCGAYPYGQTFARLTMRLLPGVTDGTIAGMRALSITDNGSLDRTPDVATDFVQVCHAIGRWGDIDADGAINSRDALIALSNAVGIPTGAFDVSRGDVDADAQVTSRDALAMLSNSIGLPTGGFRVGAGIADACAPQPVFARPLYFVRNGLYPGAPGVSGLAIRAANDSSVTIPGDSADLGNYMWRPRVSPADASVLLICINNANYSSVCKANADGSGSIQLTGGTFYDQSPDWSPAGDSIVFTHDGQIGVMGADGSNPRYLPGPVNVTSVAWQPGAGSRTLAYTNAGSGGYGQVRTFNLDTGADALLLDASTLTNTQTPRFVDWNAAGDSVLFDLSVYYQFVVASLPAGGGPLTTRLSLYGGSYHPLWTDAGLLFIGNWNGYYRILLAKSDGTFAIVSHDTQQHYTPGMKRVP